MTASGNGPVAGPTRWLAAVGAYARVRAGQPLLPVVRRAFLAFLWCCLLIIVPQWLVAPVVPHERSWPVLPALVVVAISALVLHRRGRPRTSLDVLVAMGSGVVVWSVGALPAGGVLFVGATFRAMYGRLTGVLLSVAFTLAAMSAGVIGAGGSLADVKLAQYAPGLLLSSVVLHLVFAAVQRYETGAAARFASIVRSSRDVVVITGADTVASYVSPASATVFGLPDGLPGNRLLSWVVEADRDEARARVAALLAVAGSAVTWQCRVPTGEPSVVANVEISAQNLMDDPHVHGLLFAVRDITERTRLTEQLRHQACHDPLTGLANRTLFNERLGQACDASAPVALLLLDLDSFKTVNDTLGHEAGDELLRQVAGRLGCRLDPGDLPARLGGDEFAILLLGERAERWAAELVAARLLEAFDEPMTVTASPLVVSASIGIAAGEDPVDGDRLLREADIALYLAKRTGKARFLAYDHELHQHLADRMRLQVDLQDALSRREFVLRYQPIHDLATGEPRGVEALVRWSHPRRGTIGPGRFIPLAERSGLIVPLGRWVLAEACLAGASWHRLTGQRLQINVNVSVRQFVLGDMLADVRAALAGSGLPPASLTLEITESALATEHQAIESQLTTLRQLGVRITLDDFGTGFSSLGHLHRYPIDELKIDKLFVDRIGGDDPTSLPVISAIMAMSRGLRLQTVAEGIETEHQRRELIGMGCELGQGFALSRPLTEAAVRALLLADPRIGDILLTCDPALPTVQREGSHSGEP